MIDSSSQGWPFFFWTFHIWYKVMNNTCYIFSPLFLFHCFSQVATNFTFTSETSLILLLPKCLPFLNVSSPFLKWKKMIDSSSRCWFFLFWTFHIWYKVMNNTCYIFSPLFLFHCFSQVATNFTFTSETSLILLLLKCLPSNATKKSLVKSVEHKLEEAYSEGIRDGYSTGTLHFTQSSNFSTTSQTYLDFLL